MGDHLPHVVLHVGQAEPVRHHLAGHVEGHVGDDGLGVLLVLVLGQAGRHGERLLHARDEGRVRRDEAHVSGREELRRVTSKTPSVPEVPERTLGEAGEAQGA